MKNEKMKNTKKKRTNTNGINTDIRWAIYIHLYFLLFLTNLLKLLRLEKVISNIEYS